jgi:hypothetical protein
MTNVYVDIPNRMFNTHAYVSSNLICGTTVRQEEERKNEALQRKLSVENKRAKCSCCCLLYFIDMKLKTYCENEVSFCGQMIHLYYHRYKRKLHVDINTVDHHQERK